MTVIATIVQHDGTESTRQHDEVTALLLADVIGLIDYAGLDESTGATVTVQYDGAPFSGVGRLEHNV